MDNKLCKYQLKYLILFAEKLSTKNMKQAYWDLDLIRLSAENAAVHLNKEFILIDTRIAVIAFASEYFQTALQIDATMTLQRRLYSSPLYQLSSEAMEESMAIYRLMKAKITETDNPFRKGALLGYTQVLTYNSYKYLLTADTEAEKLKEKSSRRQELYTQFIHEVQKSYTKERSISYYADVLCVTPKYLSQIVHQVSGRFAGDWITDFVILEAKALLKSRKYTVQQIADMLNFANQSFFGKYFKSKVGCSPSEYQKA